MIETVHCCTGIKYTLFYVIYKRLRLRLEQHLERNKKAGEAEEIRLIKENLSLDLAHLEKKICVVASKYLFLLLYG